MIGQLPETLTVSGKSYTIRTDYRNILQVLEMYQDLELEWFYKSVKAVHLLFYDFPDVDSVFSAISDGFDLEEAMKQIVWFIDCGEPKDSKEKPVYDWVKDEQMIFSAANKVAGKEIREVEYMHWWTFLGYLNEMEKESHIMFVAGIRYKLNHGKKLERHEKEFYQKNKDLVDIKPPMTEEEKEYQDLLTDVLG